MKFITSRIQIRDTTITNNEMVMKILRGKTRFANTLIKKQVHKMLKSTRIAQVSRSHVCLSCFRVLGVNTAPNLVHGMMRQDMKTKRVSSTQQVDI